MKRFFISCALALGSFAAMLASTLGDTAAKIEAIPGISVVDATEAAAAEQPDIKLCKAITPSTSQMPAVQEIVGALPAEMLLTEMSEGNYVLKVYSETVEGTQGEMLVVIESPGQNALIYMQGDMEAMLKGMPM